MTQETYEQARIIERQIAHIGEVLTLIHIREYECKPPIRHTSFMLKCDCGGFVELNEGEMVTLRDALELKKEWLKKEFEKL